MKKLFQHTAIGLFCLSFSLIACQKVDTSVSNQHSAGLKPRYSTIEEFRQGMGQVFNQIQQRQIIAYLDTLPDGYPNRNGGKVPLCNFGFSILEKLQGNTEPIASGVYNIFHFDEATFSLISYLMKAQMAGDISEQVVAEIAALIPLPPIPVVGVDPPKKEEPPKKEGDCCSGNICNPKIDILVT